MVVCGAIVQERRTGWIDSFDTEYRVARNENGIGEAFLLQAPGGGDYTLVVAFREDDAAASGTGAFFQTFEKWKQSRSRADLSPASIIPRRAAIPALLLCLTTGSFAFESAPRSW
jgi:hypothetical protein